MSWALLVDPVVRKRLARIPRRDTERILAAIREMAINPFAGDIEKMEGAENAWRRRIGAYRILYEVYIARKFVYVSDVRRRTSHTY